MSENNNAICFRCKHFDPFTGCPAFPEYGIPEEILLDENDHSKPLPEQKNNIVFEPINEE